MHSWGIDGLSIYLNMYIVYTHLAKLKRFNGSIETLQWVN